MKKKVVFLDIDGTLLLRDGSLPASAKAALELARQNGHEMVLCTGRSASQLRPVTKLTDFDGVVCAAGTQVFRGGKVVCNAAMDPAHVDRLVEYFHAHDMPYFLQSEQGIWTDPPSLEALKEAFSDLGRNWDEVSELFGILNTRERPQDVPGIQKCCYFSCPKPAEEVEKDLGGYFAVVDSSYKVTRFCDGEINLHGVNKATGMAAYLEAAGVPVEDSIAFGDGPNDTEMITYAGLGVVMGNGTDQLKALADRVCGRIDEDGLYNEFLALGLID